ncbi:MAG: hypothetical protein ABSA86_13545, partial [Oryzomonas sp.]
LRGAAGQHEVIEVQFRLLDEKRRKQQEQSRAERQKKAHGNQQGAPSPERQEALCGDAGEG